MSCYDQTMSIVRKVNCKLSLFANSYCYSQSLHICLEDWIVVGSPTIFTLKIILLASIDCLIGGRRLLGLYTFP